MHLDFLAVPLRPLEFTLPPPTLAHAVRGAGLRTSRRRLPSLSGIVAPVRGPSPRLHSLRPDHHPLTNGARRRRIGNLLPPLAPFLICSSPSMLLYHKWDSRFFLKYLAKILLMCYNNGAEKNIYFNTIETIHEYTIKRKFGYLKMKRN